jgi:hypothetical protein
LYNIKINADAPMKYFRQKYNKLENWDETLGYYYCGYKCIDSCAGEIVK